MGTPPLTTSQKTWSELLDSKLSSIKRVWPGRFTWPDKTWTIQGKELGLKPHCHRFSAELRDHERVRSTSRPRSPHTGKRTALRAHRVGADYTLIGSDPGRRRFSRSMTSSAQWNARAEAS